MDANTNVRSVWIFGYGSLIWNPGFKYNKRIVGYVEGYARRLWQENITHRGTPKSPGRVATLVKDSKSRTTGIAYELLGEDQIEAAIGHCEVRENVLGGYKTMTLPFYTMDDWETSDPRQAIHVRVHIATPENPYFTGPTPVETQARQIAQSAGATGHNIEYLNGIVDFVRKFSSDARAFDSDLFDIENKIKSLLSEKNITMSYLINSVSKVDVTEVTPESLSKLNNTTSKHSTSHHLHNG